MNYEIRKISRPINESLREQAFGDNNNMKTGNDMIAETEAQAFTRAQHWDDVSDSVKVQHYKAMKERAAEYEAARIAGAEAVAKSRTVNNLTRHSEKLEASLMIIAINNSLGGAV